VILARTLSQTRKKGKNPHEKNAETSHINTLRIFESCHSVLIQCKMTLWSFISMLKELRALIRPLSIDN